jgi:hypothetical protein
MCRASLGLMSSKPSAFSAASKNTGNAETLAARSLDLLRREHLHPLGGAGQQRDSAQQHLQVASAGRPSPPRTTVQCQSAGRGESADRAQWDER